MHKINHITKVWALFFYSTWLKAVLFVEIVSILLHCEGAIHDGKDLRERSGCHHQCQLVLCLNMCISEKSIFK